MTLFDTIIARVLLESGVMLFVFAFIVSMAHLVGYEIRIENPLGVLAVCLSMLLLGSGIGFVLGYYLADCAIDWADSEHSVWSTTVFDIRPVFYSRQCTGTVSHLASIQPPFASDGVNAFQFFL